MNRKTWVAYLVVTVLLVAGIAVAVSVLYAGRSNVSHRKPIIESFSLLQAIPSDAALLLCCDESEEVVSMLTDSTHLFRLLVSDGKKAPLCGFLEDLKGRMVSGGDLRKFHGHQFALSLHYSGSMVPLVLIDVSAADSSAATSAMELAATYKLACGLVRTDAFSLLLLSPSESLVGSSRRHIEEGVSILSDRSFADCASAVGGRNVLFLSHAYADRMVSHFLARDKRKYGSFLKNFAAWSALSVEDIRDMSMDARGVAFKHERAGCFADYLASLEPAQLLFDHVLPHSVTYACSMAVDDVDAFTESYRKHLDDNASLAEYKSRQSALKKSAGIGPVNWARALQIKEVVHASWRDSVGLFDAVMIRLGKKNYELITGEKNSKTLRASLLLPQEYAFSGFASAVFGDEFSVANESCFIMTGEWLISGSREALQDFVSALASARSLEKRLEDASLTSVLPSSDCILALYFSPIDYGVENFFSKLMCKSAEMVFSSADYEPIVFTYEAEGMEIKMKRVWNSNQ